MDKETNTVTNATAAQDQGAAAGASTADAEKTFTQAEVDALIAARLARAAKGMPDKAELTEFRNWKSSQQTEADKLSTAERERDEARSEAEQYKRQLYLLSQGVPADDLDYYAYKIGKMVTQEKDFETAAGEFLKGHPVKAAPTQAAEAAAGSGKEEPASAGESDAKQTTQQSAQQSGARFTTKLGSNEGPKTKEDIMAIKDRKARRAAIAEHLDLFESRKEK